jgi:archaellum component FlaD/FlaE
MKVTIKSIADIFYNQNNQPISEEDCEIYCIIIEDEYKKIVKNTGYKFDHIDRVLQSIKMLQYDDGNGMKEAYKDVVLSMGVFLQWVEWLISKKGFKYEN